MKPILEVNGKTNEKSSAIRVQSEGEELRNNPYLEYFAGMVKFGLKLLTMLKRTLFNHSSQEKFPPVLSFVQIPGKLTPGLLQKVMFIVSSITVKNSTAMEKEIISMVWRDSGVILNENSRRKGE